MREPKDIKIGEFTLKEILERHKHWWFEDCDGWRNMRANLSGANLSGANLFRSENVPFIPMACPDTGSFIGWKKAQGLIVKLMIPETAKRSSSTGRKCRCDKAEVIQIESLDGEVLNAQKVSSDRDAKFIYTVGEIVSVDDFDENRWIECAPGIHFFINRQEAVNY